MSIQSLEEAIEYRRDYERNVDEAAAFLKERLHGTRPEFGIVLGSGLEKLAETIDCPELILYSSIPHFPVPTVEGHAGMLWIGKLEGVPILGFQGRKHYYEVADEPHNTGILQVAFPVHVLANLQVPNYFATNAAGGLHPRYNIGDLMVIRSHMSEIPNPLLGTHYTFTTPEGISVPRFVPLSKAYDPEFRKLLRKAGSDASRKSGLWQWLLSMIKGSRVHEGVYMAMTGPTYETEAECIDLRRRGVDAVGMSTVPEVIVARSRGMRVVAFSCITNKVAEDGTNATSHDEVKRVLESKETKDRLANTIRSFFQLYNQRRR